ncbi:uncharacterized protein [Aquarana catesbeiana]|uniref:uncharacterized protein isoform X1 n=2 Tax=Aquarana catesbeiana TaxID=8400 RepID=UPI003CC95127
MKMEKERSHMTERILDLTLEIIYLLTGENYIAFKLSNGLVAPNLRNAKRPFTKPPPPTLTPETSNDKKIQEVTNKIIELLTGEVPIRCQDVTVSFSMEEWEYLEGHKDLYKDVMMENRPPLISPDGSSNRNTPESSPSPLHSWDSTQEQLKVPYENQAERQINVKAEVTERKEEKYLRTDVQCKKEKVLSDESSTRNPPERCPRPLCSRDSTQEHHRILQYYTDGNAVKGEVKMEAEDPYVMGDGPCKKEEIPPESSTATQHKRKTKRVQPLPSPDDKSDEEDITSDSAEESPIPSNLHPILSSDPSMQGGCFSDDLHRVAHHTGRNSGETLPCPECGGCFSQRAGVNVNTGDTLYSCSECGKCFTPKTRLAEHIRTNTGTKPYSCPQCGKGFPSNAHLIIHYRLHTGEKPYSCSECGKRFHQKSNLNHHQVIHSGEKPYSCLECGKRFLRKADLVTHQKTHSGLKPYSCPHCGKCYRSKSTVVKHQRIHMA